ncbi:hypothetical protein M011DRAFT_135091 [Sporormia fimetaria CBS 119925]|uniref:Uncharacterized protein n=1 Tax=Sporormia fimetaria CBS 119925 TaxID=1340428 RepID=A0A6A6V7B4_9PLEO|nr:hypothetical protein M011DRAFT_135091 [Sporormia fimetaria CBS 119925]
MQACVCSSEHGPIPSQRSNHRADTRSYPTYRYSRECLSSEPVENAERSVEADIVTVYPTQSTCVQNPPSYDGHSLLIGSQSLRLGVMPRPAHPSMHLQLVGAHMAPRRPGAVLTPLNRSFFAVRRAHVCHLGSICHQPRGFASPPTSFCCR